MFFNYCTKYNACLYLVQYKILISNKLICFVEKLFVTLHC